MQVGSEERTSIHARAHESELLHDILRYTWRGSGGQGQHRNGTELALEAGELTVRGSEVVAPLADAVGFVHGDEPEIHSGLVVYPELIYREYSNEGLINETVLKVALRCYYPQELIELVEDHGFYVTGRWGGYQGGRYGELGDLVVEFART